MKQSMKSPQSQLLSCGKVNTELNTMVQNAAPAKGSLKLRRERTVPAETAAGTRQILHALGGAQ